MKTIFFKFVALIILALPCPFVTTAASEDAYNECKSSFEDVREQIQSGDYQIDAVLLKLTYLTDMAMNLELETDANKRLFRNILTLRGNLAAQSGYYTDLITTASIYSTVISEDDETIDRLNTYILKNSPKFADRMSGVWVSSHVDMSGAPMMVLYVGLDEEKNEYKAMIDPRCNLYRSKAYANGKGPFSLYVTEGVEYTPSQKRMRITFKDGMLKKGNTEITKSLSDSFEKTTQKTTEGIAIANRNNPLSGKNIGAQVLSEGIGRISQGILSEISVSKVKSYLVDMELYEVQPGVLKVHMDYNTFIKRSDGPFYMDDFVRREFFLYKVGQNDMGSFWSKYGQVAAYGHDAELAANVNKENAHLMAWLMLQMRTEYIINLEKKNGRTHTGYTRYNKYEYSLYNGKILDDITNNPTLTVNESVAYPCPVDKDLAKFEGQYRFKKDADFFDSPMFLCQFFTLSKEDYQDFIGVRFKDIDLYQKARENDRKKFISTLEPAQGTLYYFRGNNHVRYEGSFRNSKFDGVGAIISGETIIEKGEFKNGKLKK